ncbi:MAG: patatin-like phospholipase family protein [Polynucleobacter victoriensis]
MSQFDQVVLAGGGNRCWWQAGFWHVLNEKIPQTPKKLIAISAGAATACLFYARPGKSGAEWGLNYYAQALDKVRKNANWANLFSSDPVFPHHQIYRTALKNILGGGFDLIKRGPEIEIGLAKTPAWLGPRLSVAVGLTVYNLEKYFKKSLHPTLGKTIGFTREFIRAQDCSSEDDLIELILQSSCTPPFTPVMYRGGQAVLDGGLVDNVPIDGLSPAPEGMPRSEVLVLLTRRYSQPDYLIKELPGLRLTYVQPSRPVPISSWDYAHHELMPLTYQQGRADAETAFSGGLLG